MKQEIDQTRGGTMETQSLAESVRVCAATAETAATRSEQVRRVMPKWLRQLESLVSRSATPSPEERGPLPTRRQRRQQGGSDYAPAADARPPVQGSSQERRA
ncbi:hypothetical protein PF010_g21251 [Phytophthora fragariae]|uniref:Uncharacterized protein n=1 Tax=Phytophthora fragariae TaxID=53985 RepID=A0A6A3R3U8_9STRA|nr:hypothetical protein PF009_g24979 [Phytophthora fragariae]KAE9083336.1 hypothetical protein PF010_g21251 [Phytophthora fragariae]KAE9088854.1 hypothetical protein PF007_g19820 [Phytophthora fragariae]KAE9117547.1 hypothetical protein PF006_g18790 [Phytophthora fragariae]KAE9190347.1 hypothetical protein PF002_g24793 [Phytophthora fragariae]